MYRWVDSHDDLCLYAPCGTCAVPWSGDCAAATSEHIFRFAVEHGAEERRFVMELASDAPKAGPPAINLQSVNPIPGARVDVAAGKEPGVFRVCLVVPPSQPSPSSSDSLPSAPPWAETQEDDELIFTLTGDVPSCRIVVRRTGCRIGTALLHRRGAIKPLLPETRSAILWSSWKRFSEVVMLKRFGGGKTGSDVLVFRPRLRDPEPEPPALFGSALPGVISDAWGSCLLAKTGKVDKVREEWERFHTFLADRLHPFMARSEAYLTVRPEGSTEADDRLATVIGSFLGGDLLQAESLKGLVKGGAGFERCGGALKRLFAVLAPWYEGSRLRPLKDWSKIFRFDEGGNFRHWFS